MYSLKEVNDYFIVKHLIQTCFFGVFHFIVNNVVRFPISILSDVISVNKIFASCSTSYEGLSIPDFFCTSFIIQRAAIVFHIWFFTVYSDTP